jgi:hypothetical protein
MEQEKEKLDEKLKQTIIDMTAAEEEKYSSMVSAKDEKLAAIEAELNQKYEECEAQRKELEEKSTSL